MIHLISIQIFMHFKTILKKLINFIVWLQKQRFGQSVLHCLQMVRETRGVTVRKDLAENKLFNHLFHYYFLYFDSAMKAARQLPFLSHLLLKPQQMWVLFKRIFTYLFALLHQQQRIISKQDGKTTFPPLTSPLNLGLLIQMRQ